MHPVEGDCEVAVAAEDVGGFREDLAVCGEEVDEGNREILGFWRGVLSFCAIWF